MPQAWPDIVAHYQSVRILGQESDGFGLAYSSVRNLAEQITGSQLADRLYGWTSMQDLCVQQLNRPPYTCPYLRISPQPSGEVDFRYADTPVEALQWRRKVEAADTTLFLVKFLDDLKWMDRESTEALLRNS